MWVHMIRAAVLVVASQHYLQAALKAVEGGAVVVLPMILTALAEEQSVLMQEEMPLHGFETGLHPRRAPLMADPHTEGTLHQHPAQVTQLSLGGDGRGDGRTDGQHTGSEIQGGTLSHIGQHTVSHTTNHTHRTSHLVACDGYLMHGVVD